MLTSGLGFLHLKIIQNDIASISVENTESSKK